jgi:hypothetical protein
VSVKFYKPNLIPIVSSLLNEEVRLWPDNPTPANTEDEPDNGASTLSLGLAFNILSGSGKLLGAYVYCHTGLASTIDLGVGYSVSPDFFDNYTDVYSEQNLTVPGTGWQRIEFANPPTISAASGRYYFIRYRQTTNGGAFHYGYTGQYFNDFSPIKDGVLFAPSDQTIISSFPGEVEGQGQYRVNGWVTDSTFQSFNRTNYWIDPIYLPDANYTSGLISHYTFEEGSGTTINDQVGSNNLTMNGASWVTGKIGGGLSFDGTNDYLSTTSAFSFGSNTISIAMWLNWTSFSNNDDLLMELSSNFNSNNGSFLINPNADVGSFFVAMKNEVGGTLSATFNRPSTGWHHYVFVFDYQYGTIRVFVDNVEMSLSLSGTFGTNRVLSNSYNLYIMSRNNSSLFGQGIIDDLRIYNRALGTGDINALYNAFV